MWTDRLLQEIDFDIFEKYILRVSRWWSMVDLLWHQLHVIYFFSYSLNSTLLNVFVEEQNRKKAELDAIKAADAFNDLDEDQDNR